MAKHIFVAYVPVLHEGYRRFFECREGERELYLLGPELIQTFPVLKKEIRQLDPVLMKKSLEALDIFSKVEILDEARAREFNVSESEIVLADEEVSRELAQTYFPAANISYEPIFLRWDKHNALAEKPIVPDERITRDELHRRFLSQAETEASKSSDIWRHVGALIARDGECVLVGHNAHVPSEHMPYVHGDPRSSFHKGDHIELSTALHAEAGLIAEAAQKGISLEGADMYLTVFPCPPCAKLIAYAGIKNLYCGGGYSVLDGEDVLKSKGIKIYFVE